MDLNKLRALPMPNQNEREWWAFVEFVSAYFQNRGIVAPVVVELGTHTYCQKAFYETFMHAVYIGIDICNQYAQPTILGDTHAIATLAELRARLGERPIDLLFIDADHAYESVKKDYEMYAPLAPRIVAFHDILCIAEVGRFWNEVQAKEHENPNTLFMTFGQWGTPRYQTGIGVMVKQ